jgi:hypothetical protein
LHEIRGHAGLPFWWDAGFLFGPYVQLIGYSPQLESQRLHRWVNSRHETGLPD